MALQGTLDTFSLPDVLRLLATTGKTGCLHLDGDRGRGRVWMDDGSLVAATADQANANAKVDEVIFEMLRFDRGSFRFAVDERAPEGAAPSDVEGALRRASQLLEEWRGLADVVPSLNHQVTMAPELTVEQVTIDASRWEALVAVAGGRSVSELGEKLGMTELGITRAVSDLVELGIVVVEPPSAGTTRRASSSERRNVTDIGTRLGEGEAPRRPTSPRDTGGTGVDDPSRVAWAPASGADPTPTGPLTQGDPARRSSRYRDTASGRQASTSSNGADGSGSRLSAARAVGTVTPPGGNRKVDSANGRSRQANSTRSTRSRRPSGSGLTTPPPTNGQVMPQTRNSHALAPAPAQLPERDPSGETLRRLEPLPSDTADGPGALPVPERAAGPLLPPSTETGGPIFPPSLETSVPPLQPLDPGHLGPAPLPSTTGQIPAIAASALPADLSWAAEDDDAPIGPATAASSVFPGQAPAPTTPPPPRLPAEARPPSRTRLARPVEPVVRPIANGLRDGELAPHVVAMSAEARAAVEATVGRSGGAQANGAIAPVSQEQYLNRGQLLRFLSSVRA